MAGSCPCGDLRCICVRPCLCCSCTCWCDECRRLRKGHQFCDLCRDATINRASMCGVLCKITHHESLVGPQWIRDGLSIAPIARRFRSEASGHSSNAEAASSQTPTKNEETDEDSDEPIQKVDGHSSSEIPNKHAEGSATNVPDCSKSNLNMNLQSCSQPRNENLKMIDLSGCSLFDASGNIINPEEYRQSICQRRSNMNISESSSQGPEKTVKDALGCSRCNGKNSKQEESKIIEAPSAESKSPKNNLKSSSSDDSALSDKLFSISPSPESPLSVSAPSAFSIPQPRQEFESRQRMPNAPSTSVASTSRMLSMMSVSNAHSADSKMSESKLSVKLIPESSASGHDSDPQIPKFNFNQFFNDMNNRRTLLLDQRALRAEIQSSSPEKSDREISSGPNSPEEDMEMHLSSDESGDESSSKTDSVSRKC